ncbi:Putative ribonuclease H protein At1g65750 [Linum perenne]
MQTVVLSLPTCEEIDKRVKNYIWGSPLEERKLHLISWGRIYSPKVCGGLGFRNAGKLNKAYLVKMAFIFFQEQDLLWVRILQS